MLRISILPFLLVLFFVRNTSTETHHFNSDSPVKWEFSAVKKGTEAELQLTALIDKGWHLYSQHLKGDGPIATSFTFTESKNYRLIDKVQEPEAVRKHDENFDLEVAYFSQKVTFTQRIQVLSKEAFEVKGYVTYMCCDDHKCLPPEDVEFSISVAGNRISR